MDEEQTPKKQGEAKPLSPDSSDSSSTKKAQSAKRVDPLESHKALADHMDKLWKGRIEMVKQGHLCLKRAQYAEATVLYEKYLKILQLVVKVEKRDQLQPKQFSSHPKEVTVIASVLWDLMLIYDTNPSLHPRQKETAHLLSRFLRFTPVYNTIIRKAEKEALKAKNPQAFVLLLKLCDAQVSRCFIANEAFHSPLDPSVILLCRFRDQVLRPRPLGRKLIALYYRKSPGLARFLHRHPSLKSPVRILLRGVVLFIRYVGRL